ATPAAKRSSWGKRYGTTPAYAPAGKEATASRAQRPPHFQSPGLSATTERGVPGPSPAAPLAGTMEAPRILIVDDEAPIRTMLGRLLEGYGYACTLAADAVEARTRLRERPFALILCDVNMPG